MTNKLQIGAEAQKHLRDIFPEFLEKACSGEYSLFGYCGDGYRLMLPSPTARRTESVGVLPPEIEQLMLKLLDEGGSWTPEKTHEFVGAARTLYEMLS